jgi:hypothetical protein
MIFTPKLRYVKRMEIDYENYSDNQISYKSVQILQQWWEKKEWAHDIEIVVDGEWRDIPIEEEA